MITRDDKINFLKDWFIGMVEPMFWVDSDGELGGLSHAMFNTFEDEVERLTCDTLDLIYKDKGGEDE